MDTRLRDILALALGGLLIGGLLGALAAGVYATWATGGDAANVGFTTILAFAPSPVTLVGEPFRTAAMIGGGVALALTVGVPAIGFRREPTSHGSARWAATREMRRAGLLSSVKALKGPVFGKLGGPRSRAACLTSTRIPHSLIAAPTGAGKGVGIVTPTLLTFPGSILCLDLKGANYANTARHREVMGDRVFKFAPYDPDGRTHRFNPLDDVAAAPPRRRYTEARRLAASLVDIRGEGAQGFLDGARDIFAAAALLVIERETPTIAALHDALSQPGRANVNLLKLGREVESPEAKSVFNKFSGRDDKHLSAYLSILMDGGLGLWADPMVRDVTAATDFSIADMRSHATSIYIVIPPTDIIPLAPLVRLIFQQAVSILQRSMPDLSKGEKYPVLFLLDEFVTLGRMDNLKTAITTLREFNVRVMLVVQTISSLRDLYGRDGAGTFLANCGVEVFMGPADEETPDYISKAIGDFTRKTRAKSWKVARWRRRGRNARMARGFCGRNRRVCSARSRSSFSSRTCRPFSRAASHSTGTASSAGSSVRRPGHTPSRRRSDPAIPPGPDPKTARHRIVLTRSSPAGAGTSRRRRSMWRGMRGRYPGASGPRVIRRRRAGASGRDGSGRR